MAEIIEKLVKSARHLLDDFCETYLCNLSLKVTESVCEKKKKDFCVHAKECIWHDVPRRQK